MTDPDRIPAPAIPAAAPSIAPPPPFAERRRRSRRAADQVADEETRLLAMALDVLASERSAETRLADLLDLLADTVGAARAAVVADAEPRRVAVAASGDDDTTHAVSLATWLDAAAPRTRAQRAAAGPADVVIATRSDGPAGGRRRSTPAVPCYAWLPIPAAGNVTLGFAFAKSADAAGLGERLPPALARHAAVALALVTESMSTERELAALRAREVERVQYVSTVAHELRTPLTGLSGYLDLILDGHVDDEAIQREFLERGRSIAGSMTALIGDLLELSRLESGSLQLDVEPFSVADMLHTVGAALLPIAMERDVPLITTPPTRIRTATGDRRRVEQIVTNLAANALKFGAVGAEVELTGRFDGPAAVVVVRDEGPGIGAEDRARVFDRFYRMADHERVTGTGLGLSISRDLARRMGGDLDVASLLGTGSAFILVLPGPRTPVDPDAIAAATQAAVEAEADRLEALAAAPAAGTRTPTGRRSAAPMSRGAVPAVLR
ncbi:MAG TPA: HAMP domain-containing sensor histidine kinase [Candidatus Limnocylindrales bacterium]|nr:HAMP domain-containing sensor histidine kinase [Candidatus Limnocylindrales bacterium]